jgi:hypothetical protein
VHGYIVQDWCHRPLLSNVKHVLSRSRVDSLILLIMNSLMTQGGLQEEDFTSRLVYFGVDSVSTFQGLRSRIIIPFTPNSIVISVHCMVHWINLAIQALSPLPLVSQVEAFL